MVERRVTVAAEVGLHARPAAMFVQVAAKAPVEISVAKVVPGGSADSTRASDGGEGVDAKSILAVLGLDVRGGEEIVLRAEGEGAEEALSELVEVAATAEAGA